VEPSLKPHRATRHLAALAALTLAVLAIQARAEPGTEAIVPSPGVQAPQPAAAAPDWGAAAPPEAGPRPPPAGLGEPPADTLKAPERPPAAAAPAESHRRLVIDRRGQRFVYSEGGQAVRSGPVSTGRRGYGTPPGSFRVLSKQRHKVSSRYDGPNGRPASMPYSIQFHRHYFIHQGKLPGYAASHGCVRLRGGDAQFLFGRLRLGDPVIVR
jgi:lipoprotein-anchoring transpeptidase ErfK/SrfK